MVHQHFQLVPRHTVLENLLVGKAGPDGRLSRRTVLDRLAAIGRDFHIELDPDAIVGDLSIGEQQRVEIAKSLVRGARILVLDEPTATLTPREAEGLFRALRGDFTPKQHFGFEAAAWYWHFVDVVWLFLFFSIYIWGSWGAPIAHG